MKKRWLRIFSMVLFVSVLMILAGRDGKLNGNIQEETAGLEGENLGGETSYSDTYKWMGRYYDIPESISHTEDMALELQDEEQEILDIDFPKVRKRFSQGNLKLPKSFQRELFLYDTVSNAVGEYCREYRGYSVFSLNLEKDMLYENTEFLPNGSGGKVIFEYPLDLQGIDFGQKNYKFKIGSRRAILYVEADLDNQKILIYPPECECLFVTNNCDGNPAAYEQIVMNEEEGGVKYYPDIYVTSDWDNLGREDGHFAETYRGMLEDMVEGKLDYLVLEGDVVDYNYDVYINIAVALGRYMEENHIEDVFHFDFDKDIISQVTNMIFTCRLRGSTRTLYMDIDSVNLKAHVYEVEETERETMLTHVEETETESMASHVEETEEGKSKSNSAASEETVIQKQNRYSKKAEDEGRTWSKSEDYMVSPNVKISGTFMRELFLYQYMEYGLRKYNEERQSDKDYFCDIEEDMISYYAKLGMEQKGVEPFKTDLAKELLPELRNNLFNFCLHGEEETLYMQIDTYNMKIYIYDSLKES